MTRKAAISLIFVALLTVCNADESVIEYARVQKAQNLSGVIRDQTGIPIPQVAVEEMSDDWSTVLQHTLHAEIARRLTPRSSQYRKGNLRLAQ